MKVVWSSQVVQATPGYLENVKGQKQPENGSVIVPERQLTRPQSQYPATVASQANSTLASVPDMAAKGTRALL